jgi:hypothetical protein
MPIRPNNHRSTFTLALPNRGTQKEISIENCAHIPDAVEKLKKLVVDNLYILSPGFTLLYPIYMEIMGGDHEDTMHQIAWLVKDEADKNRWGFNRVGGLDGSLKAHFFSPV